MSDRNTEDKTNDLVATLNGLRASLEGLANRQGLERRFLQEVFEEIGRGEKEKRRRYDKLLLGKLRADPEYEKSFSENEPLVTVIIPTYERAELIAQRTLPSVISQDYQNWEVIIVGDHASSENCEILKKLNSDRIRFYNLKRRGKYPLLPAPRWHVAGIKPVNFGLWLSRGRWIAHLDDDDEFMPNHISSLLSVALSKRIEWVHGQVLFVREKDGSKEIIGSDPPTFGRISRLSSLYHGSLKIFKYNSRCWKYMYPGDWDLWERFLEMGVTHAHLGETIGIHHGAADVLEKLYITSDVIAPRKQQVQTLLTQIEGQLVQLQATVRSQQQALTEKDEHITQLASQGTSLSLQLESVQAALAQKESQVVELIAEREKLVTDVGQLREKAETQELVLSHKEQQVTQLQAIVQVREHALREIEDSLAWILITKYRHVRNKLFPDGSRRRMAYDLLKKVIKILIQEGPKSVLRKTLRKLSGGRGLALIDEYHRSHDGGIGVKFLKKDPEPQQTPARLEDPYEAWLRVNAWTDKAEAHLRERLKHRKSRLPLISVVMPVFDPQIHFLEEAIESVRKQIYENWELCIADDASRDRALPAVLEKWVTSDFRIKVSLRSEHGNTSRATNTAAELAEGDFLVFLNQDDLLSPDALAELALYLEENPETDVLYSDNDKIDEAGRRFDPQFKPDWSPELLLSYMYCGCLLSVRRRMFQKLGGMREGYEGAEDYDFTLRATEQARQVGHIPLVLYHRRAHPEATVSSERAEPQSCEVARRPIQEALSRRRSQGSAYQPGWACRAGVGIFWHEFPDTGPRVAIILAANDRHDILRACLSSIESTTYKNYEVVVVDVDNGSDDPNKAVYLQSIPHRVVRVTSSNNSFNFSAVMNRAVGQVDAEYVLFLNTNTEVREPRWLSRMVGYAQMSGVGAVGARLLFPDGRIQHCGIVHGLYHGMAGPAFKLLPANDYGYLSYGMVARNYSAISGACMLTPRQLFLEAGGFDEENFAVAYNDVDYCYRLVKRGYRCVYCPGAELLRHEGHSRGFAYPPEEVAAFKKKYRDYEDPWYNPNLSLSDEKFKIQPRKIVRSPVRTLRTLMCSHNLNWEGAPQSQYELAVALKKFNVIEPVIYSPISGPLKGAYQDSGIEVVVTDHPLLSVRAKREFDDSVWRFAELVRDLDVEVVYANTLQTFYAIAAAERIGLPSLWNPRESEPWQTYFDFLPSEIRDCALECFRHPYRVVFVSDATRIAWEPLNFAHNFTVIRNGLDIDKLKARCASWTREAARQTLQLQEDETALVLLGTVCERKGQQDLPLALNKVPKTLAKGLRFYIVGDRESEYSNELKRLVSNLPTEVYGRVHIIPETSDIGPYYLASDMFLCTSRLESYPRVILEAMAFGLPIITTDVFGIKEQVQEKVNALFYRPGDADGLATAIIRLASDKDFRAFLAGNSTKMLRSLTTFDEMVSGYAELFREAFMSKGYTAGRKYKQAAAPYGQGGAIDRVAV